MLKICIVVGMLMRRAIIQVHDENNDTKMSVMVLKESKSDIARVTGNELILT